MIPGLGSKMKQMKDMQIDEKDMNQVEAIIQSDDEKKSDGIHPLSTASPQAASPMAVEPGSRCKPTVEAVSGSPQDDEEDAGNAEIGQKNVGFSVAVRGTENPNSIDLV